MDRYNFEEHITAYLDNELSVEEKKQFEELMGLHSECRTQFEGVKKLITDLKSAPQLKTSDDFMERLHTRIESHKQSKTGFLGKISQYFSESKARPALNFAVSIAAVFIIYTVVTNDNSENLTDTEVSPLKMEKAPEERMNAPIRLARADEEHDSTSVKDKSSDQENR